MTNEYSWQEPQPAEVDSLVTDAERMLQDEATQQFVRQRGLIDRLKPSASFAREVAIALQLNHRCFDHDLLDKVLAAGDVEIRIWSARDVADRVANEEQLTDLEALRGFVGGLTSLHDVLGSENARDKRYNKGSLDLAAVDYNATVVNLSYFFSEDEAEQFSAVKNELDMQVAPLTLGILDFDEEGWAIAPGQQDTLENRLQASVNMVHDEHVSRLKENLPAHDNQSRLITAVMIAVDGMVQSTGTFRKENELSGDDWSDFFDEVIYDSNIASLLQHYRKQQYHDMSPENEEQVAAIIKQYAKAIIAAYDELGVELPWVDLS